MKRIVLFLIVITAFISSCKENKVSQIDPEIYDKYISVGHDIAIEAQKTLLLNVSKAMKDGGAEHAVKFCHLKALPIIDSLNIACHCKITRISFKNRNPDN